jgi:hypothetical protein
VAVAVLNIEAAIAVLSTAQPQWQPQEQQQQCNKRHTTAKKKVAVAAGGWHSGAYKPISVCLPA